MKNIKQKSLTKKLWPLYVGYFLQWSMFWFAVEKLFMQEIGFDSTWIGINVAVFSIIILLLEFPSGVLADKWSRKGTLLFSNLALTIACVIGAVSNGIISYLTMSVFWGIFMAFQSGTIEAIIYDSLVSEKIDTEKYEREYSKLIVLSSIAMIVGAFAGGIIGERLSIRSSYLLSIPAAMISMFFISLIKEPKIISSKKDGINSSFIRVFSIIISNKKLLNLMLSLLSLTIAIAIVAEMRQLWFSDMNASVFFFGIASVISSSTYGIGSLIARFIKKPPIIITSLILSLLSISVIIYSRVPYLTVTAHFCAFIFMYGISIVLIHRLLDHVPSELRASSASAVSMTRQIFLIPMVIVYGYIADKYSSFSATWIVFILIVLSIAFYIISRFFKSKISKNC